MANISKRMILQSLYDRVESEIGATYKELDLIKNAGIAIGILTAILTYIGYSVSKDAFLSYASFSFFVFVFLFTVLNFLDAILRKRVNQLNTHRPKKTATQEHASAWTLLVSLINDPLISQIIMPLLYSLVVIYVGLFLLHGLGLAYSSARLSLNTIFVITNADTANHGFINDAYGLSVVVSIISIFLGFRHNKTFTFFGYAASVGLIELTSFAFVIGNLAGGYTSWTSYQLWLAVVIDLLVYFALNQYIYAVNAGNRLVKYKNELSILKARLDPLLASTLAGSTAAYIYKRYQSLEREYKRLEKPKLIIAEGIPLLLRVYVALDMSKEV